MKYLYIFLIIMVLASGQEKATAQQTAYFSTYIYQGQRYNPAALGDGQIGISYRRQWADFDAAIAPKSFMLFGDLSNLLPASSNIGLGFNLQTDKAHIFSRTNFNLLFNYRLFKNKKNTLALGITAGFVNQRLDFGNIPLNSQEDLAIYSGKDNGVGFDGGPGLYYQYKKGANRFVAHLALPQLFTSNLEYTSSFEQSFEHRTHLIFGAQYRFSLGKIALEPALLLRTTNGTDGFGKGTNDLHIRASFLKDRFWVGLGNRFNGSTFLGSFGTNFLNNSIQLQAFVEFNSTLGSSYEVGLVYDFKEKEKIDRPRKKTKKTKKPDQNKRFKPADFDVRISTLSENLNTKKLASEAAKATLGKNQFAKVELLMSRATQSFNQANYKGLNKDEIRTKITETEEHLLSAKVSLNKLLKTGRTLQVLQQDAKQAIEKEKRMQIESRQTNAFYSTILKNSTQANRELALAQSKHTTLATKVAALKVDAKLEPSMGKLLKQNKLQDLTKRLQMDLNKVAGIDKNARVEVVSSKKIVYRFPSIDVNYLLQETLNSNSLAFDHIAAQLKQLQLFGISPKYIHFKMSLQDELIDIEKAPASSIYLGEFGKAISIRTDLFNMDLAERKTQTKKIQKDNPISMLELVCLQLFGANDYLTKKHFSSDQIPARYEIAGPNFQQERAQYFVLELILK